MATTAQAALARMTGERRAHLLRAASFKFERRLRGCRITDFGVKHPFPFVVGRIFGRPRSFIRSLQNMVGDRDFSSSRLLGMRSKGVADDTLVGRSEPRPKRVDCIRWQPATRTAPGGNVPMCPSRWAGKVVSWHAATCEPSSMSRPVGVLATISPETASKLICNLCHQRRFVVPFFSIRHSPDHLSSDRAVDDQLQGPTGRRSIFGKVTVGARRPSVDDRELQARSQHAGVISCSRRGSGFTKCG